MPHVDNSQWMSVSAGKPVSVPRRESLQDLIDSRPFFDALVDLSNLPDVAQVHDQVTLWERRDGSRLSAEVYVPRGVGPFPLYVHLHGGGWCVGRARNDRKLSMRIAQQGFVVVNPDYHLAPEYPFPWALEDCIYTARWAVLNAARYNADAAPGLGIGGGSAGANLAAASILALTGAMEGQELDEGDLAGTSVTFIAAMLFFGIYSFPLLLNEPGSNVGSAELWNRAYLGPQFTRKQRHPLASPVFSPTLDRFPPTYLSCGDEDSLLGHTLEMTRALTQANVPVTLSVIAGADHGYMKLEDRLPQAREEMERALLWLQRRMSAAGPG